MPTRLADFTGRWSIERTIRDALGPDGRFEGMAVLAPDGNGLVYRETGMLVLGETRLQAERKYLWRVGDSADEIVVTFTDGRFFHSFELNDGAEARHDCAPDTYNVRYDFTDWPIWQAVWRVRGPRKDYEMTSRYGPLPAGDAAE